MTWPLVSLGTVAEVQLGKMLSPKARTGVSSFPYLRNVNVQWGRLDLSDLIEMDFNQDEREKFALKKGDLLVCEGGEPGRSAVVECDLPKVFFQKALMRVRPRNHQLDTRFLQRFMEHAARRGTFAKDGNQATIAHFPAVKLNALEVPLPPLPEQRRIADILDKADAIRRKRKEAIALTEELLRSAFLEMFGDPVMNPKGWEVKPLGEMTLKISDGTHKTPIYVDSGVPFLSAKNVRAHRIDWVRTRFITLAEHRELIARCRPERGDVLLTKSGTIGEAAVVDRETEFSLFESVALLKLRKECLSPALVAALLNNPSVRRLYGADVKGVGVKHLHLVDIRKLPTICPPKSAQDRYERFDASLKHLQSRGEAAVAEAAAMFNSLVHRAFRGELTSAVGASRPPLGFLDERKSLNG